jgi:pilus assembly protein FimV
VLKTIIKTSGFVAYLLVSNVANALGLGGMAVSSNLGQPLHAEIELVAADKADMNSIVARLATVEAFKAAGIDYPYVLPKLTFAVADRESANPRVVITSAQPVNEPFVTLLVEVAWPSGKLMREYTFLLDPVDFNIPPLAEAVNPVAPVATTPPALNESLPVDEAQLAPVVAAADAAMQTEPVAETDLAASAVTPAAEETTAAPSAADTPAAVVVDETVSMEQAAPAVERQEAPVVERQEIKVVRGDSLSKIALKVKPADVSLERMLVAMYRANSEAFVGKNMNRLKAGKVIRVPDAVEIEAVQQTEAANVYRAQVEDWNAYRQQLAAVPVESREQKASQSDAGKVTAAVTEKAEGKKVPTEVLKLSKGEAVAGKTGRSREEDVVAKSKALKEAEDRAALLEKNVKDLQRLAELKKQAGASAAATGASAPVPAKPMAKPAVPAPLEVPPVEVSFIDSLLEDPLLLGGGAAGLLALAGTGLWLARRRGNPVGRESSSDVMDDFNAGSATGRIAEPVMPSPDTGDFTQQAGDAHDEKALDEVDPVAEADLFLTFGRDVQAEEVLKEALVEKPGDVPVLLKLLSIYSTRKDTNAFMSYARQVKDAGDEVAWQQVSAMGHELEPGNPFYGDTAEAGDAVSSHAEVAAEPAVDFDLGFGSSASANDGQNPIDSMIQDTFAANKAKEAKEIEDFLGTVVMQPEKVSSETTAILSSEEMQAASEAPMDFDVTGTYPGAATGGGGSAASAGGQSGAEVPDDLVFDVTSTHSGIPGQMVGEAEGRAGQASAVLDDLVFDISTDLSGSKLKDGAAEAPVADQGSAFTLHIPEEELPSAPLDIGLSGINLNLTEAGSVGAPGEVRDEHWQEVATKLDLARAYQEMGDATGAKEILEEVMRDGDESQRAAAQGILDQL